MIDVQEKLLPAITDNDEIVKNIVKLMKAAVVLETPVLYTEQYPKGIGSTISSLLEALPVAAVRFEKNTFSCCDEIGFNERLSGLNRSLIIVFGIESHICVLSTVMDVLTQGIKVVIAEDACGSRNPRHHDLAMEEARTCGASVLPTESIIYHMLLRSGTQEFKTMLPLFKT
jgi:nicotinamidase-related amidase